MKPVDEASVVRLYVEERKTLRQVGMALDIDHHRVRRILIANGVEITRRPRGPHSEAHRKALSQACKGRASWSKGKKLDEAYCRANMAARLKHEIDLSGFTDYARLKLLTQLTSKWYAHLGTAAIRQAFLDRFYHDPGFNAVYDLWIASGKDRWCYPSLDHLNPKAKGSDCSLDNLRFITWFENRAKADMTQAEWIAFRERTGTRSDLFIEAIMDRREAR